MPKERITISQSDIDLINHRYGTDARATDVEHYKLCQVIMHLEEQINDLSDGKIMSEIPIVDE